MPEPFTFVVGELSTAHLTAETAAVLEHLGDNDDADAWLYYVVGSTWLDYGWWIWAEQDDGFDELPQCLKDCYLYARGKGWSYIRFDRDAEPIAELPSYDW